MEWTTAVAKALFPSSCNALHFLVHKKNYVKISHNAVAMQKCASAIVVCCNKTLKTSSTL